MKPPPSRRSAKPAPGGSMAEILQCAAGQSSRPCSWCSSDAWASRKRPASPISTARSFACSPRRARWLSKSMTPESASRSTARISCITGAGVKEIRLQPGRYTVEASKNGKLVQQELVTVTRNGRQVVRVSREASPDDEGRDAVRRRVCLGARRGRPVGSRAGEGRGRPLEGAQSQSSTAIVVPTIENGVVRELKFNTDDVTDISPVRALHQVEVSQVFRLWRPQ